MDEMQSRTEGLLDRAASASSRSFSGGGLGELAYGSGFGGISSSGGVAVGGDGGGGGGGLGDVRFNNEENDAPESPDRPEWPTPRARIAEVADAGPP